MLIVTESRAENLWFCSYLYYTKIFLHVNITCHKRLVLEQSVFQTFFKIDFKLGMNLALILPMAGPFLCDIHSCQIKYLQ